MPLIQMDNNSKLSNKQYYINLIIVAIFTGLIISGYKLAISFVSKNMRLLLTFCKSQAGGFIYFLASFLLLALVVQLLTNLDKFSTMGSGIPVIYGLLNNKWTVKWQTALPIRFITSSLTVGSGLTLGREGPSVQLGGLVGEAVSKIQSVKDESAYKDYVSAGSASALAVAFNTPLAGVAFYIEELAKKINKQVFLTSTLTVLIAVTVSNFILPNQPTLLNVPHFPALSANYYLFVIGLAIVTAASGILFSYLILNSNKFYALSKVKDRYKFYLPFIIAAIWIYFDPHLFGVGEEMMEPNWAVSGNLRLLCYFYIAKLLLLFLAFGISVPGGNLVPLLVIGAVIGNLYASTLIYLGLLQPKDLYFFVLLALCAHFSAIVRTPITAALLVFEMSGGAFSYLFSLLLVSFTAYAIAEYCKVPAFYEDLYKKMLAKQANSSACK